jgi:crotonobetainyl-CoA:carnitine CoA-transferase CaiB-like acyl-CoA transferase
MSLPLEGIRIVAVSQYGAGPFATMHLADLGAEVIKIEDPSTHGDSAREVIPYTRENDSLFYQSFNRNKKSVTLDLHNPLARDIFRRLVKKSDVVFNNLRGDQPAKLGLNYESLKSVNPRIVCCSLSGFGTTGPKVVEPSYDYIIQAFTGLQSITGDPETPPTRAGISVIDFATGFAAGLALMVGLHKVSRTGQGCDVDVSMYDVATSMISYLAASHLNKAFTPQKMEDSAHPTLVPCQNFQTLDGWIVVMCIKEEFWRRLCRELDAPEIGKDPRFKDFESRAKNRGILTPLLKGIFQRRTTAEWLATLRGKVPCGPIRSFAEAFADPLLQERGMIWEIDAPGWGRLKEVGCPIKISDAPYPKKPAPRLGEHTEEVLLELVGCSRDELNALRQKGAI